MPDVEPDGTTVVAALRCLLTDPPDVEGLRVILESVGDPRLFIGTILGWVNGEGIKTHGSREVWDEVLAQWQADTAGQ